MKKNDTGKTADVKDEKMRALEAAIGHLEKEFGKGAVMKLGEAGSHMNVEAVPTGSLSLDIALGVGGRSEEHTSELQSRE